MLTSAPRLHVRRPSPTTAEFTVSTYPPPTRALRLLLLLVALLRLVLALGASLLLCAKWTQHQPPLPLPLPPPRQLPSSSSSSSSSSSELPAAIQLLVHHTPPGRLAQDLARRTPAWLLVPLCLAALYAAVRRIHVEERLLVLRGLGIQTSSSAATLGSGGGATRFIPTEKIQDVLINEAFWGFGVRYILVVVVEGEESLVVVFPKLLPRREVVEEVWRGVRGCLFDEGGGEQHHHHLQQQQQQQQDEEDEEDKKKHKKQHTKKLSRDDKLGRSVGMGKAPLSSSASSGVREKGEEIRDAL